MISPPSCAPQALVGGVQCSTADQRQVVVNALLAAGHMHTVYPDGVDGRPVVVNISYSLIRITDVVSIVVVVVVVVVVVAKTLYGLW